MDAKLLSTLHTQLAKIKSDPDSDFGGVNILFAGDFLQLPTVSHQDVYLSDHTDKEVREAHLHWRKLNAVVVLKPNEASKGSKTGRFIVEGPPSVPDR